MPIERSTGRAEQSQASWWEPEGGVVLPMLQDIYRQGDGGVLDTLRGLRRRVEDLERRG